MRKTRNYCVGGNVVWEPNFFLGLSGKQKKTFFLPLSKQDRDKKYRDEREENILSKIEREKNRGKI